MDAVNAGATGYRQNYSGKKMLLSTVRKVTAGEFRVPGEAARRPMSGMGGGSGPVPPSDLDRFTPREQEMLRMFARGMSYAEIAEARGNSNPMTFGTRSTAYSGSWASAPGKSWGCGPRAQRPAGRNDLL